MCLLFIKSMDSCMGIGYSWGLTDKLHLTTSYTEFWLLTGFVLLPSDLWLDALKALIYGVRINSSTFQCVSIVGSHFVNDLFLLLRHPNFSRSLQHRKFCTQHDKRADPKFKSISRACSYGINTSALSNTWFIHLPFLPKWDDRGYYSFECDVKGQ